MNDYKYSFTNSWTNATTTAMFYYVGEEYKGRKRMNLYKVFIINAFTGSLLSEHTVVGKDQGEAALGITLTSDELALKAKDDLEMIWQKVGDFEKREVQRVRKD